MTTEPGYPTTDTPEDDLPVGAIDPAVMDIKPPQLEVSRSVEVGPTIARATGDLAVSDIAIDRAVLDGEQAAAQEQTTTVGDDTELAPAGDYLAVADVVDRIVEKGVVKKAPSLTEQVKDDSRTTMFGYSGAKRSRRSKPRMMSEIDGLRELHTFLSSFLDISMCRAWNQEKLTADRTQAKGMIENMTFIGEKEMTEATQGLAAYWKAYLDGDPQRQIAVLADTKKLERYERSPGQERKSDDYVRDRILATFTNEELERYSGRIVDNVDDLKADPDRAKVILLDDWSISGRQLSDVHAMLAAESEKFRQYSEAGSVEVNLVVGTQARIKDGLKLEPDNPDSASLPVRAYYQASHAETAHRDSKAYISGIHSAVNHDFKDTLQGIANRYSRFRVPSLPRLAKLTKVYAMHPREIHISGDLLRRV